MTMLPAPAWPENENATASRAYGKPAHWRCSLIVRSARGAVRYVDTAPAFITSRRVSLSGRPLLSLLLR